MQVVITRVVSRCLLASVAALSIAGCARPRTAAERPQLWVLSDMNGNGHFFVLVVLCDLRERGVKADGLFAFEEVPDLPDSVEDGALHQELEGALRMGSDSLIRRLDGSLNKSGDLQFISRQHVGQLFVRLDNDARRGSVPTRWHLVGHDGAPDYSGPIRVIDDVKDWNKDK